MPDLLSVIRAGEEKALYSAINAAVIGGGIIHINISPNGQFIYYSEDAYDWEKTGIIDIDSGIDITEDKDIWIANIYKDRIILCLYVESGDRPLFFKIIHYNNREKLIASNFGRVFAGRQYQFGIGIKINLNLCNFCTSSFFIKPLIHQV